MPISATQITPVGYNLKVSHRRHFHNTKSLEPTCSAFLNWTVPKYDIPYQVSAFH